MLHDKTMDDKMDGKPRYLTPDEIVAEWEKNPTPQVPMSAEERAEARQWWAELRARGIISGPSSEHPRAPFRPIAHIPGALDRFLKERWGECDCDCRCGCDCGCQGK